MPLTDKQQAFIEHYLVCWNASEAARRAGYEDPGQAGYENKKKQEIQDAIQRRLDELKMSADEVLMRLSDQARSSIGDFIDLLDEDPETAAPGDTVEARQIASGWRLNLAKAALSGKLHLVKKLKSGQWGPEIELYDAHAALSLIGKHHGLFVDRIDISEQELTAFLDRLKDNLPPEDYARIVALAAGL